MQSTIPFKSNPHTHTQIWRQDPAEERWCVSNQTLIFTLTLQRKDLCSVLKCSLRESLTCSLSELGVFGFWFDSDLKQQLKKLFNLHTPSNNPSPSPLCQNHSVLRSDSIVWFIYHKHLSVGKQFIRCQDKSCVRPRGALDVFKQVKEELKLLYRPISDMSRILRTGVLETKGLRLLHLWQVCYLIYLAAQMDFSTLLVTRIYKSGIRATPNLAKRPYLPADFSLPLRWRELSWWARNCEKFVLWDTSC